MGVKFYDCNRFCCALVGVYVAVMPVAAAAQDAASARIDAIERQMKKLQSELQQLKGELGEAKQQLRQSRSETQRTREETRQAREAADRARQDATNAATAQAQANEAALQARTAQAQTLQLQTASAAAQAVTPTKGFMVGMPNGRPTIASSDGQMSFAIGGLMQLDMGGYFQNVNPNTQFPNLNNGVNLRRGRLYFVGKWDDWRVNITPDFGGSPENPTLYEANINYTGVKPITATVGYYHPFVSLEDATFPGDLLFLERPSIVFIERSVAAGIQRAVLGGDWATDNFFFSSYLTGPLYGAQKTTLQNGEQLGVIGRIAPRIYHDEDTNIHVEFSGQHAFRPNINANGIPGVSRTTFSLGDEPELRIAFDQLVSTGDISASGASVYGGEAGANWRNFLVLGGAYQINVTQTRLPGVPSPELGFSGGYVEGSWVLTGEPHPYDPSRAAWARPEVDRPFSLRDGGLGAFEIAARYSAVDLNSNVVPGISQTKTGGVYGGRQQIAAADLSWYPNDWLRFMLQFQYITVDKLNAAGTTQIGQQIKTLALRAQAAW